MIITEIHIENFKNIDNDTFQFARGTNSIYGPNGSGKTSILEAVSWALFDYLPYKNQDQIVKLTPNESVNTVNSAKTAKVEVTFISDLDKRAYTVTRNSKRSYFIVDQLTHERVAESKREILEFLKRHYNLNSTTNLPELFTNTIGVPQGTFTSIFLDTAVNRQKVFDKVLNLEDYRKASDELKNIKDYIRDLTSEIAVKVAKYETEIANKQLLEVNKTDLSGQYAAIEVKIKNLSLLIAANKADMDNYNLLEADIEAINRQFESEMRSLEQNKKLFAETEIQYNSCLKAFEESEQLKPFYDEYNKDKISFKALEEKKNYVEILQTQIIKEEKQLQNIDFVIKQNNDKLDSVESINLQIKDLTPLMEDQLKLEKEKSDLESAKLLLNEHNTTIKQLNIQKEELIGKLNLLDSRINNIKELDESVQTYKQALVQYNLIEKHLLEVTSGIKENEKIVVMVKDGHCPFLNEDCKNLKSGENLHSHFTQKIEALNSDLELLKSELSSNEVIIRHNQKAFEEYSNLELLENEMQSLNNDLKNLELKLFDTVKSFESLKNTDVLYNDILKKLESLGSPRDKIAILNKQLPNQDSILQSLKIAAQNKDQILKKIEDINFKISEAGYDPNQFTLLKQKIEKNEEPAQKYLKLANQAVNRDYFKDNLDNYSLLINQTTENLDKLAISRNQLLEIYSKERHLELKNQFESNKIELARLEVTLKNLFQSISDLNVQLDKIKKIEQELKIEQGLLSQYDCIAGFIDTSRDVYRKCGPLIGKFYIENISFEAARLYQEITQNQNQQLKWNIDYEISVDEAGFSRSFLNLSGGEQMSAALSVRLSLLRELSDINMAFFDEPTTNMDEQRRINLASQINNITSFDQLFIISHDDTFEKDIDHIIRLS